MNESQTSTWSIFIVRRLSMSRMFQTKSELIKKALNAEKGAITEKKESGVHSYQKSAISIHKP